MNHNLVANLVANACLNMGLPFIRDKREFSMGSRKYRMTDFDIYSVDNGRVLNVSSLSDYEKALSVVKDYVDSLIG